MNPSDAAMKIKVSKASGPVLDWLVAKIKGHVWRCPWMLEREGFAAWKSYEEAWGNPHPAYSTEWAWGGPILTQARISRTIGHSGLWLAYNSYNYTDEKEHMQCDIDELVAGLRCFVASKLGEEVDVPEELLK